MSYPIDENLFYSAPSQTHASDPATEQAVEETAYEDAPPDELPPPPDFKAFFTLIEDPETGEHHHPTVHYVFSDDDPDILTNAALNSLSSHEEDSQHETSRDHMEERYIIVDMAADGKTITSASSMSRDWQALQTTVAQAPSWGDDTKSEDRGLMLKISGQESSRSSDTKGKKRLSQKADNIDDLVAAFNERLESLDGVLGKTEDENHGEND